MKLQKATVELVKSTSSEGYKFTVYIGIQCDQGPEEPVLLHSVSELYRDFNSFTGSESYRTAEFCLKHGYNVLASRVNTITGKASCRKFIVDKETLYFSPPSETDTYLTRANFSYDIPFEDQYFSANLEFEKAEGIVDSNFLLLVPKALSVPGEGSRFVYYCLAGNGWDLQSLDATFSLLGGKYKILTEDEMVYTSDKFKSKVISFLLDTCNFTVEEVQEDTYHLLSETPIMAFDIRNATVSDEDSTLILSSQVTETGRHLHYCSVYDDYKVCSIYSKYPSSVDDLTVYITHSASMYDVLIYKIDASGNTIASESFQYSDDMTRQDSLSRLTYDSELVTIDIHNTEADYSGTYKLLGQNVYSSEEDFINSLPSDSSNECYEADICLDTDTSYQLEYITRLRKSFPNALIFTDYQLEAVKVVSVLPSVTWYNTGYTLRGYSYLLYLLPLNFEGSDSKVVRLEDLNDSNIPDYVSVLEELDYETNLQSVSVPIQVLSNRLPIKSVLGVVAVQNLIVNNQYTSTSEFNQMVSKFMSEVNSAMSYNMQVKVSSSSITGHTLSATLEFYVGTYIISSYRVTVVFNSYV